VQDMDNVRRQLDFWKKAFIARYGQREKTIGLLEKRFIARYGQREKTIELLQQIFLTILQIFFLSR
jgi:hypothetical protein